SDAPHPNAEIFGNGSRFCDDTDDPIDVPAVSMVWTACQKVRWTNSACCWSLGCCNWLHYVCKSTLRRQLLENLLSSFLSAGRGNGDHGGAAHYGSHEFCRPAARGNCVGNQQRGRPSSRSVGYCGTRNRIGEGI